MPHLLFKLFSNICKKKKKEKRKHFIFILVFYFSIQNCHQGCFLSKRDYITWWYMFSVNILLCLQLLCCSSASVTLSSCGSAEHTPIESQACYVTCYPISQHWR